jgi:chromosome segregation ATPase
VETSILTKSKSSLLQKLPQEESKGGPSPQVEGTEKQQAKMKEMRKHIRNLNNQNADLQEKVGLLEERVKKLEKQISQVCQKHEHLRGEYEKVADMLKRIDHTQRSERIEIQSVEKKREHKEKDKKKVREGKVDRKALLEVPANNKAKSEVSSSDVEEDRGSSKLYLPEDLSLSD